MNQDISSPLPRTKKKGTLSRLLKKLSRKTSSLSSGPEQDGNAAIISQKPPETPSKPISQPTDAEGHPSIVDHVRAEARLSPAQTGTPEKPGPSTPSSIPIRAKHPVGRYLPPRVDGAIPRQVQCKLVIFFKGKQHNHFELIWLDWNDESQYFTFEDCALRLLEEKCNFNRNDESTRLYKKAGRCRLVRNTDDVEMESHTVEHERHWGEVIPVMVARFASQNPYIRFQLEVRWEYAELLIRRETSDPDYPTTIRRVLRDHMKSNWENRKFIPRQVLEYTFEDSTIKELIDNDRSLSKPAQWDPTMSGKAINRESLLTDVVERGTHLLALCVYADIPLSCLYHILQRHQDCDKTFQEADCPWHIDRTKFDRLVELQGSFKAHIFRDDKRQPEHVGLGRSIVVPIMFDEVKDEIGKGGFGQVFKGRIHSDHHFFDSNRDKFYALKRFHARELTSTYFENEAKALRALAKVPHPNISIHLASWTQDGRFYMLFPFAEEGNLKNWLQRPPPDLSKDFVLWLLTQLRDISAAVEHIHNLNISDYVQKPEQNTTRPGPNLSASHKRRYSHMGFHYDLKAENILCFREPKLYGPQWRIGDFGTAQINEIVVSSSQQPRGTYPVTSMTQGDPEYSAPDGVIQGWTSRPYDIWSLGCIFLEVLCWVFGAGPSELAVFQIARLKTSEPQGNQSPAFWYQDRNNRCKLKSAVIEKMEELKSKCKDRGVFERLLSLTEYMMTIKPKERPVAAVIASSIEALLVQAADDLNKPDFYLKPGRQRNEIAKPPTAVPERPDSIDRRSVEAVPTTPEGQQPITVSTSGHHRRQSSPLLLPAQAANTPNGTSSAEYGQMGYHLSPTESQQANDQLPPRPRSPSISIISPDGEAHDHDPESESRPTTAWRPHVTMEEI